MAIRIVRGSGNKFASPKNGGWREALGTYYNLLSIGSLAYLKPIELTP